MMIDGADGADGEAGVDGANAIDGAVLHLAPFHGKSILLVH